MKFLNQYFRTLFLFVFVAFLFNNSNAQIEFNLYDDSNVNTFAFNDVNVLQPFSFSYFHSPVKNTFYTEEPIVLCNESNVEIGNDLGPQYCYHWDPKFNFFVISGGRPEWAQNRETPIAIIDSVAVKELAGFSLEVHTDAHLSGIA